MSRKYSNFTLTAEQRGKIKSLCKRNDFRGFVGIGVDYAWIGVACLMTLCIHPAIYPLSILIIGARQRALASLFHDASHGTLFASKVLNRRATRVLCGWPIMQSMSAYRGSHVIAHHSRLGNPNHDPDFKTLLAAGIYETRRGPAFFRRYILSALWGRLTIRYLHALIFSRLSLSSHSFRARLESSSILSFHVLVATIAASQGWLANLVLFWWVPLLVVFPVIGWLSELSEHYPFMGESDTWRFGARNRYAGRLERFFIGMHGDSFHLTHHLLPGVPYWNLAAATDVLREDSTFAEWDGRWGGIFSSDRSSRVTFIDFVKVP
ncbi:fatty acid desaturase family protein [Pandoraea anapnoica]|uniref:Fatty acid desaturase family protein n=1 Tax=Pandoraea anapnoica TaxID=2508301 RepID=A0A5E5AAU3_9BURK|nr:fatty acid desaturase family protein [Pandoraea anapnoica]VVE69633.1 fatty acid desaturase family protein [Pandoraea anapnoica]